MLNLLDLLLFQLTFPNLLKLTRTYFHLHDLYICYNLQLSKLIMQLGWYNIHYQLICMGPLTQSIGYHICFSRMVVDSNIIILDQLQPSSLPKVQVWMCENVFQTLVIRI
jgi:hypothetical protein